MTRTAWRFPLHLHLTVLLVGLVLLVGASLSWLGHRLAHQTLELVASDLVNRTAQNLVSELRLVLEPGQTAVELLAPSALARADTLAQRLSHVDMLRDTLLAAPALASVYAGYADGSFFLFRRVDDEAERQRHGAPAGTRFLAQSIEAARGGEPARGEYLYFDATLALLARSERPDYARDFDPRRRPWYQSALAARSAVTTEPYLFFSDRKVGLTVSKRSSGGRGAVGLDIRLDTLGRTLGQHRISPRSEMAVVSEAGEVIAHEALQRLSQAPQREATRPVLHTLADFPVTVLRALQPQLAEAALRGGTLSLPLREGGETWRAALRPIEVPGMRPVYLVLASPDAELFAPALRMRQQSLLLMAGILAVALPLAWLLAKVLSRSLRRLAGEAEAVRRFEFSRPVRLRSFVAEVDLLAQTLDGMKASIRRFLEVSHAVAAERDFDRLLALLLRETVAASGASQGLLYLDDGDGLLRASAALDARGHDMLPQLQALPAGASVPADGPLSAAALAALGLQGVVAEGMQALGLPLVNRQQQRLGLLLLVLPQPPEPAQRAYVAALSDAATSSLETRELIAAQKRLFEAFIQLIAGAIDAKSPYTGGHCARVPELTKMLAAAACADTAGPFKDFQLDDEGWEALHVAAWLHDCGKVTTPEYVVDKASKLETLYDRLHEVRMRFEVLKRDASIACLQAQAAGRPAAEAEAERDAAHAQLDADFAFVAECNQGGEFMAPERLQRLQQIAQRRWLRTLDDRIGLSPTESLRRAGSPPPPVWEPLLADKPEHRIERPPGEQLPAGHGFQMAVPELLYHHGELHNLQVARGTLSAEERYKINEHIVQTLVMLQRLPFPKHLRAVPEIAGGHHEKMDGTGYPRRLTKEQMSPLARMMAIADIFEALTAADRPYKKGKTLSESLSLMARMAREQHIDAELFALFLRSGVYRQYAERFLRPEQIDAVDLEALR